MGRCVGAGDGASVGDSVGSAVGTAVGLRVVGATVGWAEGAALHELHVAGHASLANAIVVQYEA